MEEPVAFTLGRESSDHVRVEPYQRMFPDAHDRWDGNALAARITVRVGRFRGGVDAMLRTEDFSSFRAELGTLYERLSGCATFSTIEHWLEAEVRGDGKGHMAVTCALRDDPGMGNELRFALQLDQTEVPQILASLDTIIRAFSSRGVK